MDDKQSIDDDYTGLTATIGKIWDDRSRIRNEYLVLKPTLSRSLIINGGERRSCGCRATSRAAPSVINIHNRGKDAPVYLNRFMISQFSALPLMGAIVPR